MESFSISNSLSKISTVEDGEIIPPKPEEDIPSISNERIQPGDLLLGTYLVRSAPIHGGMGSVWCVEQTGDGKELCMKRPQPRYFAEGGTARKELFIRECESWIGLELHPHIVACYYVREVGGVPTIFAEWMKGGSLESRIRDGSLYSGTEEEVQKRILSIAIQFADGLHYAHERGLIHRDVKPDNVLLTESGEARVADFGLSGSYAAIGAERVECGDDVSGTDLQGTVLVGSGGYTRAYCSPEQEARKNLTRRTDIYSWAVSILEVYTGGLRWQSGPDAGRCCEKYPADAKLRIPDGMMKLLARCLSRDEAGRPYDFGEVDRELKDIFRKVCGEPYQEEDRIPAESVDGLNNMAVSYMEIGLKDNARRCWEKAAETDPHHAETMYNRCLSEWRDGKRSSTEIWRQLNSLSYYRETEEGQQALTTIAREAGTTSLGMDKQDWPEPWEAPDWMDIRECWLRREKLYAVRREKNEVFTLYVFNPATGEETDRYDLYTLGNGETLSMNAIGPNADGTKILLYRSDAMLLFYDLAARQVVREVQLEKISPMCCVSRIQAYGAEDRFVVRTISVPHSPSHKELWDLRRGEKMENPAESNLWQLIRGDGAPDDDSLKHMGKEYRNTLYDGLRAVPVFTDENGMMFCDGDGKPAGPVPVGLSARLEGINRGFINHKCLRITEDGRTWILCAEGLLEFDLKHGRYGELPFIPADLCRDGVCVDDDGIGVFLIEGNNAFGIRTLCRYRRFVSIQKERAPYVFSPVESYREYLERSRKLDELAEKAQKLDTSMIYHICDIYKEASGIRRFYGSATQREMARRLNDICRQENGEFFMLWSGTIPAEKEERKRLLAPFPFTDSLPGALLESLLKEPWIDRENISVSDDGQHALITVPQDKGDTAPAGPGIYLLDVAEQKIYILQKKNYEFARFAHNHEYIVYRIRQNKKTGELNSMRINFRDLSVKDFCKWKKAGIGTMVEKSAEKNEFCPPVLWDYGFYRFHLRKDLLSFFAHQDSEIRILDISEDYGLIAYAILKERPTKWGFQVWSMDERCVLLEKTGKLNAYFSRAGEEEVRLLIMEGNPEAESSKSAEAEIYQFHCSYLNTGSRRNKLRISQWKTETLPECVWDATRQERPAEQKMEQPEELPEEQPREQPREQLKEPLTEQPKEQPQEQPQEQRKKKKSLFSFLKRK